MKFTFEIQVAETKQFIVLLFNFIFPSQYGKILTELMPRIGTRKFNSRHQSIEHKASTLESPGNEGPGTILI